MILLKSIKGKIYEAEPYEGAYKLYHIDSEKDKILLSDTGIKIDNQSPYPALIQVDKNGIFSSANHDISLRFNFAYIDFLLRCICLGLFFIGFLGKFDFWVVQILIIGPILFYQAVKRQEKTVLRWQQSYKLHYEEVFALKFDLDKLIFEPRYNKLFFVIPLVQASIGTFICWMLIELGFILKVLLCILLFIVNLYYTMLLCHAGLSAKIPLNNQDEAEKRYRTIRNEAIIDELQSGHSKSAEIGFLSILKFLGIYILIFHFNEENIQKIARFVFSIYNEFKNLFN